MDRRTFLATSGILLTDQAPLPGGLVWARSGTVAKPQSHYALSIEPYKFEIALGGMIEIIVYNGTWISDSCSL